MTYGRKGAVHLSSAARDLLTGFDGHHEVVAQASLEADVAVGRQLEQVETTPADDRISALVGQPVAAGFRALVDQVLPDQREAQTPLYLLLEELPVAVLISGYAPLYRQPAEMSAKAPKLPADICAGWTGDGSMMVAIAETGQIPVPVGPPAPVLDADDPLRWHDMAELGLGAMRRRRLVDVTLGDPVVVGAMFRDTHVEPDGTETVLHEYHVVATVDATSGQILTCEATPHVLPWPECPSAAASAGRLVGRGVDEIRTLVRSELRGTSTCTHLNDLLRSLGDVGSLLATLTSRV
jgi:hypothetical protein